MKKKILFSFFFLLFINALYTQVLLSEDSEISIVTAGPGTELYEAFGHSAIRIKDPILEFDLIYNYGMFDFNAPNFYGNFTKGKLLYQLAKYDFKYFLASYKRDQRWVKQQVLNLTQQQRQYFFIYLENNALPHNATYFYDPYFNNCATKLRDITKTVLGDKLTFNNSLIKQRLSFRELMGKEIPWNTWGSFGINLALGNKLDKIANDEEYMYLPDYVYLIFKDSNVLVDNGSEKLIKREDVLLNFKELKQSIAILNPFLIFSILAILGIFATYFDYNRKKRSKLLDFIMLSTTGILGVLIVFLWFFTNHSTTPNNFNFLWAFAPNFIVAFLMINNQPKQWLASYFKILLFLLIIIPILWFFNIQHYPFTIIPLLIFFCIRYLFLIKTLKNNK
jgi:hypothetical protein